MISHQFYSRNQRSVFAAPPVDGEENMAVYGSTREPEEEESAIAPYGSDISVYNQIAGPSSRVNADGSRKMSDAGLDIDGDAIRHLQVGLLHQHFFTSNNFRVEEERTFNLSRPKWTLRLAISEKIFERVQIKNIFQLLWSIL